jgi:predicted metal-binding membrane protein
MRRMVPMANSAYDHAASEASPKLPTLSRRDSIVIVACMAVATILAWLYLIHLDRQMSPATSYDQAMAAMGMSSNTPWTATDLFFTFAMWAVMMVGMMAPSATPMILLFGASEARAGKKMPFLAAGAFALGYLAVWTLFSALAALAQWGLHQAAMLSPAMSVLSPRIGGVVLIVAGAYQLSPWKSQCLTHCRSPLSFLMTHWRPGRRGAFSIGMHHGTFCLGCCWALMAILFVVGVMNLLWVAVLTVFVLLEKVGPKGVLLARLGGIALIAAGLVWIV